jgi:hypothetical protein
MSAFEDIAVLEAALFDVGALLEERGEYFELCVIGGGAFLLQEPNRFHSTADLDVAAQRLPSGDLDPAAPLPAELARAVGEIGRMHGLPPGWLNSEAAAAFAVRLPRGFVDRASRRTYGGLVLFVSSRRDLITLKLLAAVQRRGSESRRHLADLRRSSPLPHELAEARVAVFELVSDRAAFDERLDAALNELGNR